MMKTLAALALLLVAPALASAQEQPAHKGRAGHRPAVHRTAPHPASADAPEPARTAPTGPPAAPAVVPAPAAPVEAPTPPVVSAAVPAAQAPPVNVTVHPPTVLQTGSIAGEVLTWLAAAFGVPLSAAITAWLVQLARKMGLDISATAKQQFADLVLNGLNAGAAQASKNLVGRGAVEIRDAALQHAVDYAREYGPQVMKRVGLDPKDPSSAMAVIQKAESMITNPAIVTPPVLDLPPPADDATLRPSERIP